MSLRDDLIRLLPAILEGTTPERCMSAREIGEDYIRRTGQACAQTTLSAALSGLRREAHGPIARTAGKYGYFLRSAQPEDCAGWAKWAEWAEEMLWEIVLACDVSPMIEVHRLIQSAAERLHRRREEEPA